MRAASFNALVYFMNQSPMHKAKKGNIIKTHIIFKDVSIRFAIMLTTPDICDSIFIVSSVSTI